MENKVISMEVIRNIDNNLRGSGSHCQGWTREQGGGTRRVMKHRDVHEPILCWPTSSCNLQLRRVVDLIVRKEEFGKEYPAHHSSFDGQSAARIPKPFPFILQDAVTD